MLSPATMMMANPDSTTSGAAPPIGSARPNSTATIVAKRAGSSANTLTNEMAAGSIGVRAMAGAGASPVRGQPLARTTRMARPAWGSNAAPQNRQQGPG